MQQVADWLEKLGMSEYRERFAENRIDFSVLPELTDQDLKDLGILLGDRRKILRAIAALTSVPAAHPTPAVPPAASASSSAAKQSPADGPPPASASFTPANAAGERRYLTYEAAFRENDIDETVLPGLTHETLKELGVASIGHRVKLLDAIAALRTEASAKTPSMPAATAPPSAAMATAGPVVEAVGERRYLTVLFCDLVGSTAISAQLDPEEWRDLVGAYLDAASAAVAEMGGHVAKKLGRRHSGLVRLSAGA